MATGTKKKVDDLGRKALIGVGLIAVGTKSSQVLEVCRERLDHFFGATFPGFDWVVEKEVWEGEWGDSLRLLDRIQARMEEAKWQFSFVVLDREPDGPPQPGVGTISFSHSAAMIFMPRLLPRPGAENDAAAIARCYHAILVYFARLNGLPGLEGGMTNPTPQDLDLAPPFTREETEELAGSLRSMADGLLKRSVKEVRGLALYLRILFTHPVRVIRTVLSHRPLRMVFSLGKLVFAAMAALVISLLSAELWQLGVRINIWRLILIAVVVLLAATLYVVFQQRLFVRRVSLSLSEQAAFFNLTSLLTVFSVFVALFAIIFVATVLVTLGIYPRYVVKEWLQKSELGLGDYVRVSLLISSLAMVVGALGAGLEENQHFRKVMYTEGNR